MLNIVHNIITLGTYVIVFKTLMNTLIEKLQPCFVFLLYACLLNHINAEGGCVMERCKIPRGPPDIVI